ncbi:RHS repeat-associated core domain-containing protein [Streptomyces celluloflavus]|uniref:DUF6443 domain-containing protein n=1 Tax=Streptomyces celluloflavus TaxID=58344 RepID=UPI0036DC2DCC
MPPNKPLGSVLDVPEITPFQCDNEGSGDISRSVNLFRGDVGFTLQLAALPGRNGLDVSLSARYQSNVLESATARNLHEPTGVLGLGWSLPFDCVAVDTHGSGAPGDWTFALVHGEAANGLYETERRWQRGTLQSELTATLDRAELTAELRAALLAEGLAIDATAAVRVTERGRRWTLTDPVNEYTLTVQDNGTCLDVLDGGRAFETQSFDFSRVSYYPEFERWEIAQPDGTTKVFGGRLGQDGSGVRSSGGNTVQWGVRWGAWLGPAMDGQGQEQYPVAWNLARAHTPWGDEVRFEYEQVTQQVGAQGRPYTKSCYLSRITDVFGRSVRLSYGEKVFETGGEGRREYLDPNKEVPDNTADAYQTRYETRFLQRLDAVAEDGHTPLYTLEFDFDLQLFAAADGSGSVRGEKYKRTLTRIRKTMPDGSAFPDLLLAYDDPAAPHPGALSSMTYGAGATVNYTYLHKELATCVRSLKVTGPFAPGTPRVWFGPDYAVVLWYDRQAKLSIDIYTWIGRWRRWRAGVIDARPELTDMHVVLVDDFFVLHHREQGNPATYVRVWHKDDRVLGGWLTGPEIPRLDTERREVTAGSRFFVVNDRLQNRLTRYTWNPRLRTWIRDELPDGTGPRHFTLFTGASNNALITLRYDIDAAPGAKQNVLQLHQLDGLGGWHTATAVQDSTIEIAGQDRELDANFRWAVTPWSAIASSLRKDGDTFVDCRLDPFTWTADRAALSHEQPWDYRIPKNQDARLAIPWAAQVSPNGVVATGGKLLRFTGGGWRECVKFPFPDGGTTGTLFWFALGTDHVLKVRNPADGQAEGSAWVFRPDQGEWREWDLPAGTAEVRREHRNYPTAAAGVATFDNSVFLHGGPADWSQWKSVGSLPVDTDTTTVVANPEPAFLVYFREAAGQTEYRSLSDDQLAGEPEKVPGRLFQRFRADGAPEPVMEGQLSPGPNAFGTYEPSDAAFDDASSVTLHRCIRDSAIAPLTHHPVGSVTIDDGYDTRTHHYAFDIDSAACDPTGNVVKYYRTSSSAVDGPGKGPYGWTEYRFINGVGGQDTDVNPTAPALLDGLVESRTQYDTAGALTARTESAWSVVTTAPERPGTPTVALHGGYARETRTRESVDGVTKDTTYSYEPTSGQRAGEETTTCNGDGTQEVHESVLTYGHQVYDALWKANRLTHPVQRKSLVTVAQQAPRVVRSEATAWQPFPGEGGRPVWEPHRTFRWLGDGAADFDFGLDLSNGPESVPPATEWRQLSVVACRSVHGQVLECEAPPGVLTASLYDRTDRLRLATFTHASPWRGDALFFGCEAYQDLPAALTLSSAATLVLGLSHSGERCLAVGKADAAATVRLTPLRGQAYLFSCWARTSEDRDPGKPAGWSLALDGVPLQDITVRPSQEWVYYARLVHVPAGNGPASLVCTAFNQGDSTLHVDDLTFAHFRGQYRGNVHAPHHDALTAELGPYDAVLRRCYDSRLRVVAETDRYEGVTRITVPRPGREGAQRFSPDAPDSEIGVLPAGVTYLDRFREAGAWQERWSATVPAQWRSDGGRLSAEGTAASAITLTNPQFTADYGLHLSVCAQSVTDGRIGLAVGSELTVEWDARTHAWTLVHGTLKVPGPTTRTPGRSWLLVLGSRAVLFWVDGQPVFSHLPADLPKGAPTITASLPASFTNVIVGGSCQVTARYFDGAGKSRQVQSLEGDQVVATGTVPDLLGRAAVQTEPARLGALPGRPLLSYRPGFVTALDWGTGVLTGEVAKALPEDQGYPYTRQRYEASPLGREVETGRPGKEFAIAEGGHTLRTSYGTNPADLAAATGLPATEYRVRTSTDPDGRVTMDFTDLLGRKVRTAVRCATGPDRYLITSHSTAFDQHGRVDKTFLPNYQDPRDGSAKDDWVRTVGQDMLGHRVAAAEPNSGETRSVYDARGALRFIQGRAAKAAGLIGYYRYDDVGRLLEEGVFSSTWDRDLLQRKALQEPDWPASEQRTAPRRIHFYDQDGAVGPGMGRLARTVIKATDDGLRDAELAFGYDERGRPAKQQTVVAGRTHTTDCTYDNLGNVAELGYPSGLRLLATRDEAGRVSELTDRSAGRTVARFAYDAAGRLAEETVLASDTSSTTTTYRYNSPGWPVELSSPLATETIDYTGNGYRGAGFHSGKVAAQTMTFALPSDGGYPKTVGYQLAYDRTGRLSVAQCTADGKASEEYSLGLTAPVQYDANGNLTTVDTGSRGRKYVYDPGTDFVLNTRGTADRDYEHNQDGSLSAAHPRKISDITYDPVTRTPVSLTFDQVRTSFQYDAQGQRLLKQNARESRSYLRTRSGACLMEEDTAGTVPDRTEYLYGPNGVFALYREGQILPVLRDRLHSPRAVLDDAGRLQTALHYTPYGCVLGDGYGPAALLRRRFAGYEADLDSGLHHSPARLYDPVLRRFCSVDPELQFATPYSYVGDDPMSLADPSGEAAWWEWASLGIGIALAGVTGGASFALALPAAASIAASAVVMSSWALASSVIGNAIDKQPVDWGAAGIGVGMTLAAVAIGAGVQTFGAPLIARGFSAVAGKVIDTTARSVAYSTAVLANLAAGGAVTGIGAAIDPASVSPDGLPQNLEMLAATVLGNVAASDRTFQDVDKATGVVGIVGNVPISGSVSGGRSLSGDAMEMGPMGSYRRVDQPGTESGPDWAPPFRQQGTVRGAE